MAISEKIDKKKVSTFIVTSNGMLIQGDVYMIPEIKMFDELNVEQRKFLAVAGAKIYSSFNQYPQCPDYELEILVVNKEEMMCVALYEEHVQQIGAERKKVETLLFTPGGLRIEGEVFVPSQIRLIDALNLAYGNFYAISNAKLFTSYDEANAVETFPLVALNKFFIMCAHPMDTPRKSYKAKHEEIKQETKALAPPPSLPQGEESAEDKQENVQAV